MSQFERTLTGIADRFGCRPAGTISRMNWEIMFANFLRHQYEAGTTLCLTLLLKGLVPITGGVVG